MSAQRKKILPQEGTTGSASGESLTEPSSVCPSYSGGGNLCSQPGSSLDLSGLMKAIPATQPSVKSPWTVVTHKRPCKRESTDAKADTQTQGQKSRPERVRHNRRARRKALQPNKPKIIAAAETQRETTPSTSTGAGPPPPPPPPVPSQSGKKRKPRGARGRRTAAMAPIPEKEQQGKGSSTDERASSKRARLDETQSPRGDAKRAKTDPKAKRTVSYADAAQSHLKVVITTVPQRDLSQTQAEAVRVAVAGKVIQTALSPSSSSAPAPSFRGRPFLLDGALAMWCEDANSLRWLEEEVKNIESPIPDTTLTVIRQSDMKKKLKAGLLIHTSITDPAILQRVLCAQNPWYKVDSWQCYDMTVDDQPQDAMGSEDKVVHLTLGIPEDQKQTILDRDRRVAHITGSGYIRFFSTVEAKTAGKQPVKTTSTSETEAKETSTPEPSASALKQSLSEVEVVSPLPSEGCCSSDEDGVLRSP